MTESDKSSDKTASATELVATLEKSSNSLPSSPEKRAEKTPPAVSVDGEKNNSIAVKAVPTGDEILNDSDSESSEDEDDVAFDIMSEEEKYRRQREKRERVSSRSLWLSGFRIATGQLGVRITF